MFCQSVLQPQVVTALSQLTSLLNTPRICVSKISTSSIREYSTSNKGSRTPAENDSIQKDVCKESDILEYLPKDLSIEELCPLLNGETHSRHVEKICREAHSRNTGKPWSDSYVSADTFFENKTGFPESYLLSRIWNKRSSSSDLQSKEFQRFLHATVRTVFFQQSCGFLTRPRARVSDNIGRSTLRGRRGTIEDETVEIPKFGKARETLKREELNKTEKWFPTFGKARVTLNKTEELDQNKASDTDVNEKSEDYYRGYIDRLYVEAEKKKEARITRRSKLIYASIVVGIVWYYFFLRGNHSSQTGLKEGSWLNATYRKNFEILPDDLKRVTFDDVKGADEGKEELADIVEYLKDQKKFTSLGAKLPKGVLLVGPPGTGKTLLARAVAGEAKVPFFYASGAEFDEIFVGTGSVRVSQLFQSAKARRPCVIFIDEIDSVGGKRTSSSFHPYANQTINQLLSEMDGFKQTEGVIVLGATNKVENLDSALLRPGRFDVQVRVSPPDLKGRIEILELYLGKVKASKDINIEQIARGTAGFTGADLQNLVNQSALKAATDNEEEVTLEHIEFAKDKVLMGPAKKNRIPDEKTNWNTAYHEAGHTVVAYFTKNADPVHKVTIIPRGLALGFTASLPEKEVYTLTKSQILAKMDVCMGGRIGEEVIFGSDNITTGAANDFDQATELATKMVKQFGMSDKVGIRTIKDQVEEENIGMNENVNIVGPEVRDLVDSEIRRLLQESYNRAKEILKEHAKQHKELAEALMEYETLDKDEIKSIMEGRLRKK